MSDDLIYDMKRRLEEVKAERDAAIREVGIWARRSVTHEARIAALEEGLRWYASPEAWTVNQVEGPDGDYGRRARALLGNSNAE